MIRVIVAGGRDYENYIFAKKSILEVLFEIKSDDLEFISGGCSGADTLGERFCEEFNYKFYRFPAKWNQYGKKAGYLRNMDMAKFAVANGCKGYLIVFWDGMSRGTKNMIDIAKVYGIRTFIFYY